MNRRHAIAALLAAGARAASLDRFFPGARGAALLVDRASRRPIAIHSADLASAWTIPPGSTVKPLILSALLHHGPLPAGDSLPCPTRLRLSGRVFDCSHPPLVQPVTTRTAIAYSCNCFVAAQAARSRPGEMARMLRGWGLADLTHWFGAREAAGRIGSASPALMALGEDGIAVTPAGLAMAYCRLAATAPQDVLDGLRDAVESGTAQRARVADLAVSGKTGSAQSADGSYLAWFAGFTPTVVVTVVVQGRSGGADAAPIAARILEAHSQGRL
jgi:cell division protein FtsI/penicillin-binding protein 2